MTIHKFTEIRLIILERALVGGPSNS